MSLNVWLKATHEGGVSLTDNEVVVTVQRRAGGRQSEAERVAKIIQDILQAEKDIKLAGELAAKARSGRSLFKLAQESK